MFLRQDISSRLIIDNSNICVIIFESYLHIAFFTGKTLNIKMDAKLNRKDAADIIKNFNKIKDPGFEWVEG